MLDSIAKSDIKWLSFPYTDCGVGNAIAEAIPALKVEVLDIGLFPPGPNEKEPAAALVEKLQHNKTIGAITDPVRREVAKDVGIIGLTVRTLLHEGKDVMTAAERNWTAMTYEQADTVANICRRNMEEFYMDEYYHEFKM